MEVNPNFEELDEFKSAKEEESTFYLEELLIESFQRKNGNNTSKEDITKSIGAFLDLDGENWYPIIKRLKRRSGNGKNAIYLFNSYDEGSGKEFVKAFKVNKNGKIKLLKRNFTEEMFNSDSESGKGGSSYYQLSITNCPAEAGIQKTAKGCGGGGTGGGTSSYSNKITTMKIKDKKESWIEKADVHYIADNWADVTIQSGVYYDRCPPVQYPYCDADGNLIRKYSQKDVKKKRNITVNYSVNSSSRNQALVQYTIFEYDKWPAGTRTYPKVVSGATLNIKFRSYQTAYDSRTVTYTGSYGLQRGSGVSVNNSAIEYKIN